MILVRNFCCAGAKQGRADWAKSMWIPRYRSGSKEVEMSAQSEFEKMLVSRGSNGKAGLNMVLPTFSLRADMWRKSYEDREVAGPVGGGKSDVVSKIKHSGVIR